MACFSYTRLSLNKIISMYCPVFALSGLGGENEVSRVKRERWNEKVWETLL